jgi:hypothetical protein
MKNRLKNRIAAGLLLVIFCVQIIPSKAQNCVTITNNRIRIDGILDDYVVNINGRIEVADDDKSLKSISSWGSLEIIKKTFGNSRKLKMYPAPDGSIVYEYYEGASKEKFEPEGRKWMQEILPSIIRSSGIDIEGRVKRFYRKGGVKAVLDEIELIESDFISAKYFAVLIRQEKLTESEYKQAILALPEKISSDFEKSNVFNQVSDYYIGTNALTESFLYAVSKISSDFEKARVLKTMRIADFNEIQQNYYLSCTNSISSDFEKSNVITYMLSRQELTDNTFISLVRVTDNISSDFEKSNNFKKMLAKSPNEKILSEIFHAISKMSSDFEKGNVLKIASTKIKPGGPSIPAYFDAINSMTSDFERSAVLKSIIKNHRSDEDLYIRIFNSTANLSSDFEKSNVLTNAASHMPKTEKLKAEYIKTAKTISSSHEFGNVMRAIY